MLNLKNIIAVFVFCTCYVISGYAQEDRSRFQAIENEKIRYISSELNLSKKEAQQFFPVYNEYSSKLWDLKQLKTGHASPRGAQGLRSENRDVIAYDAKEVAVKKEYREKFSKIIGPARASQFFQVEQDFRDMLYKRLQQGK